MCQKSLVCLRGEKGRTEAVGEKKSREPREKYRSQTLLAERPCDQSGAEGGMEFAVHRKMKIQKEGVGGGAQATEKGTCPNIC